MKTIKITAFFAGILALSQSLAQTFPVVGTVTAGQTRNVLSASSSGLTNSSSLTISNTGPVSLKFFMAATATSGNSGTSVTVAAGSAVNVTLSQLGGLGTGDNLNVTNISTILTGGFTINKQLRQSTVCLPAADAWVPGTGSSVSLCPNYSKVGIGTSNPAEAFHVKYKARIGDDNTSGSFVDLGFDGAHNFIESSGTQLLLNYYNHKDILAFGNIGIGTWSPAQALHVKNKARFGDDAVNGNYIDLGFDGAHNFIESSGTQLLLNYYNHKDVLTFGNVGIGTWNPGQALHVRDKIRIGEDVTNGRFIDAGFDGAHNFIESQGSPLMVNYYNHKEVLLFGNVGIGTGNPGQALHVKNKARIGEDGTNGQYIDLGFDGAHNFIESNGDMLFNYYNHKNVVFDCNIICKQLDVVPDYVFENSYDLMTLEELEQFVKKNHHLPEIPSAQQIEKEGFNLADNQLKLLKKVEELTLYIIEQQKELDSMKKKLATLKKGKN